MMCSVYGCEGKVYGRGFCGMHYQRFKKYGDPSVRHQYIPPKKDYQTCAATGCTEKADTGDYCRKHYARWRRYGDPLAGRRFRGDPVPVCFEPGCDRPATVKGRCLAHNARVARYGETSELCSVPGCPNKAYYKTGRCTTHNARLKRGIDLSAPIRPVIALIGTKYAAGGQGYIMMVVPAGTPGAKPPTKGSVNWRMLEHRYVMQQHLGRPLLKEETIHHLSGDRSNNCLDNLELWSTSQPPGQAVRDKLKWAHEIIALYGNVEGTI